MAWRMPSSRRFSVTSTTSDAATSNAPTPTMSENTSASVSFCQRSAAKSSRFSSLQVRKSTAPCNDPASASAKLSACSGSAKNTSKLPGPRSGTRCRSAASRQRIQLSASSANGASKIRATLPARYTSRPPGWASCSSTAPPSPTPSFSASRLPKAKGMGPEPSGSGRATKEGSRSALFTVTTSPWAPGAGDAKAGRKCTSPAPTTPGMARSFARSFS